MLLSVVVAVVTGVTLLLQLSTTGCHGQMQTGGGMGMPNGMGMAGSPPFGVSGTSFNAAPGQFPTASGFNAAPGQLPNAGGFNPAPGQFPTTGGFNAAPGQLPNAGGFNTAPSLQQQQMIGGAQCPSPRSGLAPSVMNGGMEPFGSIPGAFPNGNGMQPPLQPGQSDPFGLNNMGNQPFGGQFDGSMAGGFGAGGDPFAAAGGQFGSSMMAVDGMMGRRRRSTDTGLEIEALTDESEVAIAPDEVVSAPVAPASSVARPYPIPRTQLGTSASKEQTDAATDDVGVEVLSDETDGTQQETAPASRYEVRPNGLGASAPQLPAAAPAMTGNGQNQPSMPCSSNQQCLPMNMICCPFSSNQYYCTSPAGNGGVSPGLYYNGGFSGTNTQNMGQNMIPGMTNPALMNPGVNLGMTNPGMGPNMMNQGMSNGMNPGTNPGMMGQPGLGARPFDTGLGGTMGGGYGRK